MLVARREETISRCARPDGRLGWGRWAQMVAPGEETMPSQASAPKPASTPPSAADFDQAFSASVSPGIRRVWERAEPGLPAEVEPFSFVSPGDSRLPGRARIDWPPL